MAFKSDIEWTEATWNPVTGCTKLSTGCLNCYAERLAIRLRAMGNRRYVNGFQVTLHEDLLGLPMSWASPRMIFVNSMSDLFHKDVPLAFIKKAFSTMTIAKHHVFQVLTKRADRLAEVAGALPWPDNVWMGVSVENAEVINRIDKLREIPAKTKFLSMEPLLGSVPELDLHGMDWVIVGGESGPGARAMKEEWALDIRDQCIHADVPFFFKQWGGVRKKHAGRRLQGRLWNQMPKVHEAQICY